MDYEKEMERLGKIAEDNEVKRKEYQILSNKKLEKNMKTGRMRDAVRKAMKGESLEDNNDGSRFRYHLVRADEFRRNGSYLASLDSLKEGAKEIDRYLQKSKEQERLELEFSKLKGKEERYANFKNMVNNKVNKSTDMIKKRIIKLLETQQSTNRSEFPSLYRNGKGLMDDLERYDSKYKAESLESSALTPAILTIGGIVTGLFFLSSNITGNVTSSAVQSDYNLLGAILFVSGLVGSFLWAKRLKHQQKGKKQFHKHKK